MNNKELIVSELAKVIDFLPRCYLNYAWTTKIIWSWWHKPPAFTCKSGTCPQGCKDSCRKDRPSAFEKVVATGPYVTDTQDLWSSGDQIVNEAGAELWPTRRRYSQNITIDLFKSKYCKTILSWSLCWPLSGCSFRTFAKWATPLKSTTWGLNSSAPWW